ncbi:MAG: sporulation protein YqfD [Dorea sp.]|nr:sporulation protein YqfD [Dorea sp.]
MLLFIFRYIKGYLKIRVMGYSPERFLNACSHRKIYIWGIRPVEGSYDMYISVSGFRKLRPIIKKTGARVIIRERIGLPFYLFRYRKRKVFFAGAVLGTAFVYVLSLFVWSIDVRGNRKYTDEAIIAFLEEQGVEHGMKLSSVDCDRIVKDIRKSYDEIIWVSASIEGCRLIVQIKENEDSEDIRNPGEETRPAAADTEGLDSQNDMGNEVQSNQGTDIVADQDGLIQKMIVRKGIPCVAEGQQVKKGDVLVSGAVPVVDDAGETTGYQFQHSDADIRAEVTVEYQDICERSFESKEYIHQTKEQLYLKLGKRIFWLGSSGSPFPECEELTTEHRLRIGEYFYLPVSWGSRVTKPYLSSQVNYDEEQLQTILSGKYRRFADNLVKKGVEIIENDVKIYTEPDQAKAKGTLTVITDIGTGRPTSITEDIDDGDD